MICSLCGNNSFMELFDLGILPLGYPIPSEQSTKIWKNSLKLILCKNCMLIQTEIKIPTSSLVDENHYLSQKYDLVSSHDKSLASEILSRFPLSHDSLIMEIGSGDGSFLEIFHKKGFTNLLGIEPSIHAKKKYVFEIINDFFNFEVVRQLIDGKKIPSIIITNYVVELVPNLDEFFSNIEKLMTKNSIFIMEIPYFMDFFKSFRLDGFAHLRCNWFTVNSLVYLFKKFNLNILEIFHDKNYRGGTLRVIVKKEKISNNIMNKNIQELINNEKFELNNEKFLRFNDQMITLKHSLTKKIYELKNEGIPIIGYGGGLKASTLVNWLNLSNNDIKFVVDTDPDKQFKIMPNANIPIKPLTSLTNINQKLAVIILANDHTDEIEKYLKVNLSSQSCIIKLLPNFSLTTIN